MIQSSAEQGNHLGAQLPGCTWHFLVFPSRVRARAMRSSATDVQQVLDELVCSIAQMGFSPVSLIRYLTQHISDSRSVANE